MSVSLPKYPQNFSGKIAISRDKLLGKGNYGMVFAGIYEGHNVAVKRIEHYHVDDREVKLQIQLRHVSIVNILTVEEDEDFRYIVLEMCAGSLQHIFQKTYTGPPLPSAAQVLYQIANGLDYIHSQEIIHRDVRPKNILISTQGIIKLSDFGISKPTTAGMYAMSGRKGHYSWMAPEVLRWCQSNEDPYVKNEFSPKSDIFSAGCVFFMFVTAGNKHPFGDNDIDRSYNISISNIINAKSLPNDHFAAYVIRKMIKQKPEDRVSLETVKKSLSNF